MRSKHLSLLVVVCLCVSVAFAQGGGSTTATKVNWNQLAAKIKAVMTAKNNGRDPELTTNAAATEDPRSPYYYYVTKTQASNNAQHAQAPDGKALQKADFELPGDVFRVDYGCSAPYNRCGHTFPCDGGQCGPNNESRMQGHHYAWFMKTDDGNDLVYSFAVHFQKP